MSTIVNIIDAVDPLPMHLFVREKWSSGDRLMFISTLDDASLINVHIRLLGRQNYEVDSIILPHNGDELAYELIRRTILTRLRHNENYLVNLAGGTRYMALAVQRAFESFNSSFFYTMTYQNTIISSSFDNRIFDGDDIATPVRCRLGVGELLAIYQVQNDVFSRVHSPLMSLDAAMRMFHVYLRGGMKQDGWRAVELLRTYARSRKTGWRISELIKGSNTRPPMLGLDTLFSFSEFAPSINGWLTADEVDWLTGGWFEELVYYIIKNIYAPDDIKLRVRVWRQNKTYDKRLTAIHTNELDIIYAKNNRLYVVECKTGVESQKLFNQILYKACALRETFMGIDCESILYELGGKENIYSKHMAALMGVKLVRRSEIDKQIASLVLSRNS